MPIYAAGNYLTARLNRAVNSHSHRFSNEGLLEQTSEPAWPLGTGRVSATEDIPGYGQESHSYFQPGYRSPHLYITQGNRAEAIQCPIKQCVCNLATFKVSTAVGVSAIPIPGSAPPFPSYRYAHGDPQAAQKVEACLRASGRRVVSTGSQRISLTNGIGRRIQRKSRVDAHIGIVFQKVRRRFRKYSSVLSLLKFSFEKTKVFKPLQRDRVGTFLKHGVQMPVRQENNFTSTESRQGV